MAHEWTKAADGTPPHMLLCPDEYGHDRYRLHQQFVEGTPTTPGIHALMGTVPGLRQAYAEACSAPGCVMGKNGWPIWDSPEPAFNLILRRYNHMHGVSGTPPGSPEGQNPGARPPISHPMGYGSGGKRPLGRRIVELLLEVFRTTHYQPAVEGLEALFMGPAKQVCCCAGGRLFVPLRCEGLRVHH